jgi:hypothetical protein
MLILNYAHPFTANQLNQIEQVVGQKIGEVKQITVHLNQAEPLLPQVVALADAAGLNDGDAVSRPRRRTASFSS